MRMRCGQGYGALVGPFAGMRARSMVAALAVAVGLDGVTRSARAQSVQAQSVQVDGKSATTVRGSDVGGLTVNIAPKAANGVSHNTYNQFSVPKAGVALDNTTVNAGTIINEVTSARRSTLEGPLSVTGTTANVIVANPNGITVNGGSFVNIGGLGLIAGSVSAPTAAKPQITLSGQDILVGSDGLSAAVTQLDLVARSLRVTGKIEDPNKTAIVNLTTGQGTLAIDPTRPANDPAGWITLSADGEAKGVEQSIVLDQGSVLTAGSIRLTANGTGAGVRMGGAGLAGVGDFALTAAGKIVIEDASIAAERDVAVTGKAVELTSRKAQTKLTAAKGGVMVRAADAITANGVSFQGATNPSVGFDATGAVNLIAGGHIAIAANAHASQFTSTVKGITIQSGGRVDDRGSVLSSAEDVSISASAGMTLDQTSVTSTLLTRLVTDGPALLSAAKITAGSSFIADVGTFQIDSITGTRAVIDALSSGVFIKAAGDIINRGALVQGNSPIEGDDRSLGGVTLVAGGRVIAETLSASNIAAFFAKAHDLTIDANGVQNRSGRLLAQQSVIMTSTAAVENETIRSDPSQTGAKQTEVSRGRWAWAPSWFGGSTTRTTYDYGTYVDGKEIASITAVDGLTIKAPSIANTGEIIGNKIELSGGSLDNRPIVLGTTSYSLNCMFGFCRSTAASSITRDGGRIVASDTATLRMTGVLLNQGGVIVGQNGVALTAGTLRLESLLYPDAFARSGGLGLFTAHSAGAVFSSYQPGSIVSPVGGITLEAPHDIIAQGVQIDANGPIISSTPLKRLSEPDGLKATNRNAIGLIRDVF